MTHAMLPLLSLGLLVASNFTARSPVGPRRQLVAADIPETLFYDTGAVAKQVCHGSCYAETTRQLLRYMYPNTTTTLVDVWRLMRISSPPNQLCVGGLPDHIMDANPLATEAVATSSGFRSGVDHLKPATMKRILHEHGPVIVGVNVFVDDFLKHKGANVFDHCLLKSMPNHAVLLVGYRDGAWVLKNSYGAQWGDEGYFYMHDYCYFQYYMYIV